MGPIFLKWKKKADGFDVFCVFLLTRLPGERRGLLPGTEFNKTIYFLLFCQPPPPFFSVSGRHRPGAGRSLRLPLPVPVPVLPGVRRLHLRGVVHGRQLLAQVRRRRGDQEGEEGPGLWAQDLRQRALQGLPVRAGKQARAGDFLVNKRSGVFCRRRDTLLFTFKKSRASILPFLFFQGRIYYGSPAARNEFPWMAALTGKGRSAPFCGGTLISHRWVLTAAHCFYRYDSRVIHTQLLLRWFGFITGSCEKECLKVQFTAQQTISMTFSLTVGLTHP